MGSSSLGASALHTSGVDVCSGIVSYCERIVDLLSVILSLLPLVVQTNDIVHGLWEPLGVSVQFCSWKYRTPFGTTGQIGLIAHNWIT